MHLARVLETNQVPNNSLQKGTSFAISNSVCWLVCFLQNCDSKLLGSPVKRTLSSPPRSSLRSASWQRSQEMQLEGNDSGMKERRREGVQKEENGVGLSASWREDKRWDAEVRWSANSAPWHWALTSHKQSKWQNGIFSLKPNPRNWNEKLGWTEAQRQISSCQ